MADSPLLELKNIDVHYGGVKALDGVSIQLNAGEVIALLGPNGAGKSTILKSIFGLVENESGQVLWHGQEITPVPYEMAEAGISFVPQGRRVFSHLTVEENLEIGALMITNKAEIKRRKDELLALFPILEAKRKAKAGTLSGGQQQMVAIARGLMTNPTVLLLDEPSLGLAPKIVKEVFAKIKEINDARQTTMVIVEHNIKSLLHIVDRGYVLDKGRVVAEDTADGLLKNNTLEKVFTGQKV